MSGKNPFEHSSKPPAPGKPKAAANPRAAMMLSTGSKEGFEVMGHNHAPNDYRQRMPVPENLPREQVIKPKPIRKAIPPPGTVKKEEPAPIPNRRAAALLETSSGFEIMDNNLSKDNYVKRVRESQDLPAPEKATVIPKEKLTGANYIKAYRQRQSLAIAKAAQEANAKAKINKIIEGRKEESQKLFDGQRLEARKQAEAYTTRARQLQTEIALLKRQLGQDQQTDSRVQGAIQQLTSELGRIPSGYW